MEQRPTHSCKPRTYWETVIPHVARHRSFCTVSKGCPGWRRVTLHLPTSTTTAATNDMAFSQNCNIVSRWDIRGYTNSNELPQPQIMKNDMMHQRVVGRTLTSKNVVGSYDAVWGVTSYITKLFNIKSTTTCSVPETSFMIPCSLTEATTRSASTFAAWLQNKTRCKLWGYKSTCSQKRSFSSLNHPEATTKPSFASLCPTMRPSSPCQCRFSHDFQQSKSGSPDIHASSALQPQCW